MSSSVGTKDLRRSSWSCSVWRAVAGCIASLCEEVPLEDNPGLRLQLLQEERQRQLEVHRAKREAELSEAAEQSQVARVEELVKDGDSNTWKQVEDEILQRRENMTPEERLQDCLQYFDSLRPASTQEDANSPMRLEAEVVLAAESDNTIAEDLPQGCVEEWLHLHFEVEAGAQFRRSFSSANLGESGGSLRDGVLPEIVASFVSVLRRSVEELSSDINAVEKKGTGMFPHLDRLLAELEEPAEPEHELDLESLKEVRARHQAVATETSRLLVVVEEDPAACCVLLALAMVAASDAGPPLDFKRIKPYQAPTFMLSTADVCCALCSEKRGFLMKEFLFSPLSNPAWPRWSDWRLLRRTGVAWWVHGSCELQDLLVRRMTQASRERLRGLKRELGVDGLLLRVRSKELQDLVDETVLWCVVSGLTLPLLRAMLRTPELQDDAALRTLLEHPQLDTQREAFLRRNASRLQQVHRYHFAAALLLLAGSLDDASLLLSYHLRDTQLMLLALRKHPQAIARRLRSLLEDAHRGAAMVRRDPWLHLLIAAHLDSEELQRALMKHDHGADFAVFEGALRLTQDSEGLADVAQKLDRMHA